MAIEIANVKHHSSRLYIP